MGKSFCTCTLRLGGLALLDHDLMRSGFFGICDYSTRIERHSNCGGNHAGLQRIEITIFSQQLVNYWK